MADEAPSGDPFAVANDTVRSAAKWVFAAAASIGAALIAGSQLSNIGKLDACTSRTLACTRLPLAVVGVAVALVAVAAVVWSAADVLLPVGIPINDIDVHWDDKSPRADVAFFKKHPDQLGYARPSDLAAARVAAWNAVIQAEADLAKATRSSTARLTAAALRAKAEYERLNTVVLTVTRVAQHEVLMAKFRALRPRSMGSGALIAAGIMVFAWAANPPEPDPGTIDLSGTRLVGADLEGADLSGADLSRVDLTDADLGGATLTGATIVDVVWRHTRCPDGTNSDDHDGTCLGHLRP